VRGPNLSAAAVRQPSITLFLLIAVAVAGLIAFFKLGRAEDPTYAVKTMVIAAAWPGATAQEMQDQVADRLEKRLQEIRYFDRVETISRPGTTVMQVTLGDGTPPAAIADQWYQVRKKLGDDTPNLPNGVQGPFFNDEFSEVYFGLYALQARGLPERRLVQIAETMRARLLSVPGIAKVNIIGERAQRIFVGFDQARLQASGISVDDVTAAVARANAVASAGVIETSGPSLRVRLDGAFTDVDAIRRLPVAAGGRVLTVGDVATVTRGYEDPASFYLRHQGEPALMLGVVMKPRWNGLDLGKALEREVQAIRGGLPVGLELSHVSDQGAVIEHAYGEFMIKFAVALAVVMAVSFIALGFRVGIVVAASVPLTLAAVFVIMLATGRDFDRITLGALILSLGLLVDDAIIAIEMMVVKMEEGLDRMAAATFAWGATAGPMLSGTLVTIVGFVPIGFAASSSGEYAGNIFWVVGFALIMSWLVAVYFTPYLGMKLLPDIEPVAGGHDAIYDTPRYRRLRHWIGRAVVRRKTVVIATAAAFLLAAAGMGLVQQQFFPTSDRPELLIDVQLPHGSSITATRRAVQRVEGYLQRQSEADTVDSYVGGGAPRFFLALNPEQPDPSFAKVVVQTPDAKARDALAVKVRRAADDGRFPEARVRTSGLLYGPPIRYPVVFRVHGPDLARLRPIAEQVRAAMAASPAVRDPHLQYGERTPELRVHFDQARLASIGLSPETAARQVGAALSGQPVAQVRDGNRTVGVRVRGADADRTDPSRLESITLVTAMGDRVPLSNVGAIAVEPGEPMLIRWNREPFIAVRADTADGVQPPDATNAILPRLDAIRGTLPAGYTIRTGGSVEEAAKANAAIGAVAPIMLGLTLFFLMLQVGSFKLLGLTFATAPLGLIGAVLALLLFRQPFGFTAILGLIGLSGILMRNTLILVDQIKADKAAGRSDYDAIIEATVRRARPVILTALAAVLAFIPLTFSTFWGPLAFVLIGGVAVGTVLTLMFVPALYALWLKVAVPDTEPDQRHRPSPHPLSA
jgi:multidrug efflux pump subunit AcrB